MKSAVAMGASFGGLAALVTLLGTLGPGYRTPILVALHLHPHGRGDELASLLASQTGLPTVTASDHEPIRAGYVHLAPANYHMLVDTYDTLVLSVDRPVHLSRPSIDVLFESAAEVFGAGLAGVVLTGANRDGANGLAAVHEAGGLCLVQEPRTAEVPIMPAASLATVPAAEALPLAPMARRLKEFDRYDD